MEPKGKHFNEDELASIAIDYTETGQDRAIEGNHLRDCKVCSDRLHFFLEFYHQLGRELENKTNRTKDMPPKPQPNEFVVVLSSQEPYSTVGLDEMGNSELILAAKSVDNSSDRYRTIATFSSSKPPAVLRVLEDRQEHIHKVFIISELPGLKEPVRIALTDDGGKTITTTTGEDGTAALSVPRGFDWEHSHIAVIATLPDDTHPADH